MGSWRRASKGAATVLGILVLGALAPTGASAAVSCSFAGGTMDVDITAGGDLFPQFSTSGQNIVVSSAGPPVACAGGTPTLTTTDLITVDEAPGDLNSQVSISIPNGGYAPGATPEPTGISEIEFQVNLGGDTVQDTLHISAGDGVDFVRLGSLAGGATGANFNPPETGGPDADLTMTGVESVNPSIAFGDTDANTIDATGGPEFTGPLVAPNAVMNFSGGDGPDVLAGGDQANFVNAGLGNDLLISGRGLDDADGEDGIDTVSYERAPAPVTATVNTAGADTGGGGFDILDTFENVLGSPFGDTLTGDDGPNHVDGAAGTDNLSLLGDDDTFNSLDQGPDTVDCGAGAADSGITDPIGVDTVTNCENVNRPPETVGVDGPDLTNDPTPVFALTANEPASFEYRVDGAGGFDPCAATCELRSLADGAHLVEFRAIDGTPLTEQTPVSRTVTIDTAAPDTQIDSGPADGATIDSPSAAYGFSSEAGATFQCSLDDGPFTACTSPVTVDGLANGAHSIAVRATDPAGNTDSSPARRTVTVAGDEPPQDRRAPETRVTKIKVKGDKVKARFGADETPATFECRLDKKRFKPCTSPKVFRNVKDGKHKLFVRATDAAGNVDASAAKRKFKVEG